MQSLPSMSSSDVRHLAENIKQTKSILLTTHKQCDGDGLGALLGLYHALKELGKHVRAFCVDAIPPKYSFLEPHKYIEIFEDPHQPIESTELALIFDTNDKRLIEPLYTELINKCKEILFVDHHPILNQGPEPTSGSFINTQAASTGEIAYFLIKELGVPMSSLIARPLYTSIAFDTQVFKYIRNSSNSHIIAVELLKFEKNPDEIHRKLFATHTQGKIAFLSKVLSEIDFFANGRAAVLRLSEKDLEDNQLCADDARDVIDMIMNIQTVQVGALFRQEGKGHKLSLRSKGKLEILDIAEHFQGGGHMFAAGAFIEGNIQETIEQFKLKIIDRLE